MSTTVKPNTRDYSWKALVEQADGKSRNDPEPAYIFSDGKVKQSTDKTQQGFYKRS